MTEEELVRAMPVCGCGTIGEALDAAYKVVAAEKDCYHWHYTVDCLVTIIRGNLVARKMVSDGLCTAENVADKVNELNDAEAHRAQMIGDANGRQIAEWCDALFEKGEGFLS